MRSLSREIEELRSATIAQIRVRYRELFQEEPRSKHHEQLFRKIAWRLQANAEGGLGEAALQRAVEIANEADMRVLPPRGHFPPGVTAIATTARGRSRFDRRIPPPGTVLKKNYHGTVIKVKVLANGFDYQGQRYGSLSAIANQITGTRWNGLAFFGLTAGRARRDGNV